MEAQTASPRTLFGKRIVVLGGTSGIGFATAEMAARERAQPLWLLPADASTLIVPLHAFPKERRAMRLISRTRSRCVTSSRTSGHLITWRSRPARGCSRALASRIPSREIAPAGRISPLFFSAHRKSPPLSPVAFVCVFGNGKGWLFVVGRVRFLVKSAFFAGGLLA